MGFIVKVVLVLAVIAGGIWAYFTFMPKAAAPTENAQTQQNQTAQSDTGQPSGQSNTGGISAGASSDTALQGDLKTFDTQVDGAQSESAGVDQSFNDQTVQQTE